VLRIGLLSVGGSALAGRMTAVPFSSSHPVSAVVASVRAELGSVVGTPVWSMPPEELGSTLVEVTRLQAQVTQLQLRLLAQAERVVLGQDVGATSAANWLAHETRTTRPAVHRATGSPKPWSRTRRSMPLWPLLR
jgi:hypothetical protein